MRPSGPELSFSAEDFESHAAEADVLGRAHWRELYGDTPYPALPAQVAQMQKDGHFAYFVVKADGRLVGHVGFLLIFSPVHGVPVAMDLFYFVEPEVRRQGAAKRLLQHAGRSLTDAGYSTVLVSAMPGTQLGQMVGSAGYERAAVMYRFKGE